MQCPHEREPFVWGHFFFDILLPKLSDGKIRNCMKTRLVSSSTKDFILPKRNS